MAVFMEDDKTRGVIHAVDGLGFPLTRRYKLKSGVTREQAKETLSRVMERLGEEVETPPPVLSCVSAEAP